VENNVQFSASDIVSTVYIGKQVIVLMG